MKYGEDTSPRTDKLTFRKSGTVVQALKPGEAGAAVVSTADFDKALSGFKELVGVK